MNSQLKAEFQYYLDHQDELVEKYNGKVIVIRNQQVIGSYTTELEAVQQTTKQFALGTFLVQRCEPGNAAYTQTYTSRVLFA